jgi:hypothetical protein
MRRSLEGPDLARELLEEHALLAGVDGLGGAHDGEVDVVALGEVEERRDVLGEAAPAVARAREEELRPDALVAADALAHGAHVGPDGLAEPRDVVHERDARGEHRVGDVLGHLRGARVDEEQPVVVELQRGVEPAHGRAARLVAHPEEHPVGLQEVVDRVALLQELRVRHDRDLHLRALDEERVHLVVGAHRDGALQHHHGVSTERVRQGLGDRQHVLQVGAAVLLRGRAHRDEDHLRVLDGGGEVGAEGEALLGDVAADQLLEARLVDRDAPLEERVDLPAIAVDARDGVAKLREARPGDQAHVTRTYDHDAHERAGIIAIGRPQARGRSAPGR